VLVGGRFVLFDQEGRGIIDEETKGGTHQDDDRQSFDRDFFHPFLPEKRASESVAGARLAA
jgi:hypothetical protein